MRPDGVDANGGEAFTGPGLYLLSGDSRRRCRARLEVSRPVRCHRRAARWCPTGHAPFSDDPARLLSWANTALTERAGTGSEFVTAACVTYLPGERLLRWAYAGHPPALWLDDGREMIALRQGTPLGVRADPGCGEGSRRVDAPA